jgi:predicted TPR repeat methyltransferase
VSGRYAHAQAGLRARLQAAGFAAPTITAVTPRHESGRAVQGWLVTACRG